MADSSSWWVLIPEVDRGQSASFLETVDFRTTGLNAQQIAALQAGKAINDYGQSMVLWKGPFKTEADALAAQNPKPLTGAGHLSNLPAVAGASLSRLFPKLSRQDLLRLSEGVLGVLLILVGVAKLAEGSPVARTVAKAGLI